jgi:hypothetical protein
MSSREEHLKELVLQEQELYEEYVERGRQLERTRIIALIAVEAEIYNDKLIAPSELIERIKGDTK